jgi:flagellar hook protein FlgE
MFTSFSTALSALNADSTAIDVVGNNLANLNTTGYKEVDVTFHDLVTQSIGLGLGSTQVGFGVGQPNTERQFTQGGLQSTSGPLDAAIQGAGFFVVSGANNSMNYTRDGSFQVNASGDLIDGSGEAVQGWSTQNGVLNTNGAVANIIVPVGTISAPVATTTMSMNMNLNAAGATGDTFSQSLTAYDSLGVTHQVTVTFTKDATVGQWDYSVSVPDADLANPPYAPVTGSVTFDSNGNLLTPAATDPPVAIPVQGLADGASDMNISWNVYNGTTPDLTQFAQPSALSSEAQNGTAAAQLSSVALGTGGQVLAEYTDGSQAVVGQLALAQISNPDSLTAVGNNDYQVSGDTAVPAVGAPSTGGRGSVVAGSLEESTVDIATEFTNLIIFQRAYEANGKVITTVDQMSQDTINLKS